MTVLRWPALLNAALAPSAATAIAQPHSDDGTGIIKLNADIALTHLPGKVGSAVLECEVHHGDAPLISESGGVSLSPNIAGDIRGHYVIRVVLVPAEGFSSPDHYSCHLNLKIRIEGKETLFLAYNNHLVGLRNGAIFEIEPADGSARTEIEPSGMLAPSAFVSEQRGDPDGQPLPAISFRASGKLVKFDEETSASPALPK